MHNGILSRNVKCSPPTQDIGIEMKFTVTKKMTELSIEEVLDIANIVRNSDVVYAVNRIENFMKHNKFNEMEQKFLNEFFERYNVEYNSSLAKAMSENQLHEEE